MFQSAVKVGPSPYNSAPYVTPVAQNVSAYTTVHNNLSSNNPNELKSFPVDICGFGDFASCMYSFFCPFCAVASARGYLDGSDYCVNMTQLNPILLRWITRSAYNIPGSSVEDMIYGTFLPCCTINQVLQTTQRYGRPYPGVGKEANIEPFVSQKNNDCCSDCCYTTFCLPCAIGTSLNLSMGMPFWMGCCCSNYCIARNLLRYQYHFTGQDCWDDCCYPYAICCCGMIASSVFPCAQFIICPYMISKVMMMLSAAKERGNPDPGAPNGSYLHPLSQPSQMATMMSPSMASTAAVYTTATIQPAPYVTDVVYAQPTPISGYQMQPVIMQQQPVYAMYSHQPNSYPTYSAAQPNYQTN